MMRKLFVKIARVAGSTALIVTGIFLYKADAFTSSSKADLQALETLDSDRLIKKSEIIMDQHFLENQTGWDKTGDKIDQSHLWGSIHFPGDDYNGLELGRKIGNWIVKKIGSEKTND